MLVNGMRLCHKISQPCVLLGGECACLVPKKHHALQEFPHINELIMRIPLRRPSLQRLIHEMGHVPTTKEQLVVHHGSDFGQPCSQHRMKQIRTSFC